LARDLTRSELEEILVEVYGAPGVYEARHAATPHLDAKMRALRAFVSRLAPDQEFALTADEF
jgi:hypothetical protein